MGRDGRVIESVILPSYRCAPATVVRTFVTLAVPCDQDGSMLCRYVYTLTLSSYHGPLSRVTCPTSLFYNPLKYVKIGRF